MQQEEKMPVQRTMKLKAYTILSNAVDDAVNYGYARAHKHTENPTGEHIVDEITQAVMNELCDIIDFGD